MTHEDRRRRRQEIARAIHSGKTRDWCMQKFGVSDRLIRTACDEHGVEYERYAAEPCSIVAIVAALVKAPRGATIVGIADELAASKQRVHQVLEQCREHGLVPDGKFRR